MNQETLNALVSNLATSINGRFPSWNLEFVTDIKDGPNFGNRTLGYFAIKCFDDYGDGYGRVQYINGYVDLTDTETSKSGDFFECHPQLYLGNLYEGNWDLDKQSPFLHTIKR